MHIETNLPFECCERCQYFSLRCKRQDIFAGNELVTRELTIVCEHENLCRRLDENRKKDMDED